MKHLNILALFVITLCGFAYISAAAHAQSASDDDVKPLGEILNPRIDDDPQNVQDSKNMAKAFYKKCMGTRSLAFSNEEKDMMCACTAANLDTVITPKEYQSINSDSVRGRDVRGKIIAYSYLECVDYIIESKLKADCMVSPIINEIVRGKSQICTCSAEKYNDILKKNTSYIIMDALKHDPMTLNPFEHYFTTTNHGDNLDNYIRHCKTKMLYEKHN